MARTATHPKKKPARRDDWHPVGDANLDNGAHAVAWMNLVSGEKATLLEGVHPMDNPNAIVPVNGNGNGAVPLALAALEAEPDDLEDEEETAADRVAVLLSKAKGKDRAVVKIYKANEAGVFAWCDEMSPEQFESFGNKGIAKRFGAGKYQVLLYASNPDTGKFSRFGRDEFDVMPSLDLNENQNTALGALAPVLEKILERVSAPATPATPPPDPMAQMSQMLGMMKLMREAMGMDHAPRAEKSPLASMRELIEMVGGIKTLRAEIEPPAPPDDSLVGMGRDLINLVGVNLMKNQPQPVAVPTVAMPAALSAPIAPSVTEAALAAANQSHINHPIVSPLQQPNPEPMPARAPDPAQKAISDAVAGLNMMAQLGASVENAASLVYENAPDDVIDLLQESDWFERLCTIAPQLKPYETWYREVHRLVIAQLEADDKDETSPAS